MKKKFMCMLLIISMIEMPLTYAGEKQEQVDGEVELGENFVCNWAFSGSRTRCKNVKKGLRVGCHRGKGTFSLSDGEATLQFGAGGKFAINDCEEQCWIVVRDESGTTILDIESRKNRGVVSLDEENEINLNPGSSVVLFSYDDSDNFDGILAVVYDKMVNLVSKVDSSEHSVLLSHWLRNSQQVSVATRSYGHGERKGEEKVYLEELGKEIKLLNSFFKCGDEERKKEFLGRLSICKHAVLKANIDAHGTDYPDYVNQLLQKKVISFLADESRRGASCVHSSKNLINKIPSKAKHIIKDILQNIPIHGVQKISLSLTRMFASVQYEDGRAKIIDLKNGKVIFEAGEVVELRVCDSKSTKAIGIINYKNGEKRLLNLEKRSSFLLN